MGRRGSGPFLFRPRNGCPLRTRAPRPGPRHSGICSKRVHHDRRFSASAKHPCLASFDIQQRQIDPPTEDHHPCAWRSSYLDSNFSTPYTWDSVRYLVSKLDCRHLVTCSESWKQPSVLACCLSSPSVTTDTEQSKIPQGETYSPTWPCRYRRYISSGLGG